MQGGEGGSKDWSKSINGGGGGPPWRDPPLGQFWSIPDWQATEITQNEPPPVNWNIDKWELQLRSNDLAFVTSRRPEIVSFYCWWLKSCISKISGGSMIFFHKHQLDFQPSTALIPLWLQPVTVRGTTLRDVHVLQRGEGHVTISLSQRRFLQKEKSNANFQLLTLKLCYPDLRAQEMIPERKEGRRMKKVHLPHVSPAPS